MITGAANILGPEFGAGLAEFGADLVLVDVNGEGCERVARDIAAEYGTKTLSIEADVGDETAVTSAVQRAIDRFGGLDILVNAAATKPAGYFDALEEYSAETWDRVMAINLSAMFLCTKHLLRHFEERGHGVIINIASIYGVVGPDPRVYAGSSYEGQEINTPAAYAASKAGVIGFTRYLATTLATRNIRANCVTPGGVFSGQNDAFVKAYSERVPLGRMADREELRGAIVFLASDASSYITGHNLVIDGGLTAW